MFRNQKNQPSPKPDPPIVLEVGIIGLILVLITGFSVTVNRLNAINANLSQTDEKNVYQVDTLPIVPPSPRN